MSERLEPTLHSDAEFRGTDRFQIRGRLGEGGMGVVYRAWDQERGCEVALKTLPRVDAAGIYRLKNEFRALADLSHRNLVSLHELVSTGAQWLFTMELVRGVDFVEHVRGRSSPLDDEPLRPSGMRVRPGTSISQTLPEGVAPRRHDPTPSSEAPTIQSDPEVAEALREASDPQKGATLASTRPALQPTSAKLDRLYAALRQLVDALNALHEAGKLHLDLKPSNVMVCDDGRVVVLDFGLARDTVQESFEGGSSLDESVIAGTPAFMAPEQVSSGAPTAAADWYAVGSMLYLVLTDVLPFSGGAHAMLHAKRSSDPRPIQQVVSGVPEELEALVLRLMHRDPKLRATAADVARCLAGDAAESLAPAALPMSRAATFVGRSSELGVLRAAFAAVRGGTPQAVLVHGGSGIGKTALVQHFLSGLRSGKDALVLAGRCYERESVPFKAFDSLVDSLSRYLKRLPRAEAAGLLPRGVHELGRVFPALRRVEAIVDVPQRGFEIPSKAELRVRAFRAMKELLAGIADKEALVLYIDDLQWGDLDSAQLLVELLGPPDPPPLLLCGTYRTEEETTSPFLRDLFQNGARLALELRRLPLAALDQEDAIALARELLGNAAADAGELAASVAREADGVPFFVTELARHAKNDPGVAHAAPETPARASLEGVLAARLAALGDDARRLLEIITVAGSPIEQGVAMRAAGLEGDPQAALAVLRAEHLVRTRGTSRKDAVESYHDRIRETVVAGLPPPRLSQRHLRLGLELEASGRADPEALALHFERAGMKEQAGEHAVRAAMQASEALAFDNAARLYRRALLLIAGDAGHRRDLSQRLGEALQNAGRGKEAAAAYLEAAEGAEAAASLELRRLAAEQLLVTGHVDDGQTVLRGVLSEVGLPYASSPGRALAALLYRRARLALRGTRFRERPATEISSDDLRRIDVCFSVSLGLSVVDTIHASAFQAHHLALALAAGEPKRIALGFAFEAGFVACTGGTAKERARALVTAAEGLSARLGDPHVQGFVSLMRGVSQWAIGEWKSGIEHTDAAERTLRDRCNGVTWELDTTQLFSTICITAVGNLPELRRRLPLRIKEAEERGDLYATTSLRTFWGAQVLLQLAADAPGDARRDLEATMARWSRTGFHVQHYYAMLSATLVDLYAGDGAAAWQRVASTWPALERSMLLRVQSLAITAYSLRGAAALAAADAIGADVRGSLAIAEKAARWLEGEKMGWSVPHADLIRSGIARRRKDEAAALRHVEAAARGFRAVDMALHAAVAERRTGELTPRGDGEKVVSAADRELSQLGIVRPDAFVRMLAP